MAAYTVNTYQPTNRVGLNQAIGTVSSTQRHPLGDRVCARDVSGTRGEAEFIYLSGVVGTVVGSVCLITDAYGTALVAAREKGALALATAATVANTYGWYQIKGQGVAASAAAVAANLPMYIGGAGIVDDAAVAGDVIAGMRSVTAQDTATVIVNMACNPATVDGDNA